MSKKYAKTHSRERIFVLESFGAKKLGSIAYKTGPRKYRRVEET